MAGSISENYLSRPFTVGRTVGRELIYNVIDTDDETEVYTLLNGAVPAAYLGLVLESVSATPEGGGVWTASAKYIRPENDNEYTFETGGGSVKITQSIETVSAYAPPGFIAPDFQGAIGVSDDRVEGVDIDAPGLGWTETHTFVDALVTNTYRRTLGLLHGSFNNDTFRGWNAGEVLFQGASGSKRGDELWTITFRFATSLNESGLSIGSGPYGSAIISGIDKLGWDYLWVRYADFADTSAFALVKRPVAVYVERVRQPADFAGLGIGTS